MSNTKQNIIYLKKREASMRSETLLLHNTVSARKIVLAMEMEGLLSIATGS